MTDLSPHYGIPWGTIAAFGCWMLWKNRNMALFEPQSCPPNLASTTIGIAAEFLSIGPISSKTIKHKDLVMIAWEPPPPYTFKLNMMVLHLKTQDQQGPEESYAIILGNGLVGLVKIWGGLQIQVQNYGG